ncbi:MAG: hypothetical protein HY533_03245 [Chloroflexi bacterium]|nr:hypothetical protein [Chloroflexota bacterium]
MKQIPRNPIKFDIPRIFAAQNKEIKSSVREPQTIASFMDTTRQSIQACLDNPDFLRGLRTEAMFEALALSLGDVRFLKQEDSGDVYTKEPTLRLPDLRVVLADGSPLLIEVKNYYQGKSRAFKSFTLGKNYFNGLLEYAKLTATPLKLAIYWASWNLWTLVSPDAGLSQNGRWLISMTEAMRVNEMSSIGDHFIGSEFPISLRLIADKTKQRQITDDGIATFTIGAVEICCNDRILTATREKNLTFIFLLYGDWQPDNPSVQIVDSQVEYVEFRSQPEEDHQQGFEFVGSLSSMFSRYYLGTTQPGEQIERLKLPVRPGSWGNLIPSSYRSSSLPLWRMTVVPSKPLSK